MSSAARRLPASLPLQMREAPVKSVTAASRLIEVVWTTGAAVRRLRWDGWDTAVPFDEVLEVSDAAIDLTRLKAGAPVLDSHQAQSISAQRAVVENAWLSGGKGYASLRFPTEGVSEASDQLFRMAKDKIIRNISVGYAINRVRVEEPKKAGEVERRIVERWTPYELSFVTVPADAGAQVRSQAQTRTFPVTVVRGSGGDFSPEAARARMRARERMAGLKS